MACVASVAVVASVACVASVAVVASVACVASVAVVASVACVASVAVVASVPRDAWGARDAWGLWGARDARKAYGFIRFILMSCPFQHLRQEEVIPKKNMKSRKMGLSCHRSVPWNDMLPDAPWCAIECPDIPP